MAEPWLLNPPRRRRRRRSASRRRRRTTYRRRRRSNPPPMFLNARKRRRSSGRRRSYRRRRYRRNPPRFMGRLGIGQNLAYAGLGYAGTKVLGNTVGNMIMPMLGDLGAGQPLVRMAFKGGLAYLTAWGWEVFTRDRSAFMPIFLGGAMNLVEDVVDTYLAPLAPTLLADYYGGMGVYPGSQMGVYPAPQLGYQQYPYHNGGNMGAIDAGEYQTVV